MTVPAPDAALLRQWIDRRQSAHDVLACGPAQALAATLDLPHTCSPGDALPALWHWIYFWAASPASQLGPDGHPQRGGFLPPVELPRRMWAGGRLHFAAPLPLGSQASRESRIADVSVKQGSSGPLVFVTVEHAIRVGGVVALTEEHDIVFREPPQPQALAAAPKAAPQNAQWSQSVTPDPVLLFRYSALTFNGHRIHYDRSYVTGVEGYPGLIVHGPLIATLLASLVQRELPSRRMTDFRFRAVSPLFDTEAFSVHGRLGDDGHQVQLWAANLRGELAMEAEATLA